MALMPWMDPENFNPNYLMRAMHLLPRRGEKEEWQHSQDYWREKDELPAVDLDDTAFVYDNGSPVREGSRPRSGRAHEDAGRKSPAASSPALA